jgi:pre-60S factor REI1
VYNIKQRIASLPPITLDAFNLQNRTAPRVYVSEVPSSSDEDSTEANEQCGSPFQCLFCNRVFPEDDAGFETNLDHMRTTHGFAIQYSEFVIDVRSLVGYLATEVQLWRECLYCGTTKPSTTRIQSHMRDKGHCLLNLDREPEILNFWERMPQADKDYTAPALERPTRLSATELRFPSGKVIESKHTAHAARKASRKRSSETSTGALPVASEDASAQPSHMAIGRFSPSDRPLPIPKVRPGRQLARSEEMSITGVSEQQRQTLVLAEKKAQRREDIARRTREWVYAKGANAQKFDQLDNQAKWGKQNHKLLPR